MQWLGIPYARAERFAAPRAVPFDPAGSYDRFGPAAPQALDSPLGSLVPGMRVHAIDEHSCLTLNIWAPDTDGPHPVLVWFPGGSFVIGSSSQPVYDGAVLAAEQSVVVVSVNYRLGALGFLDARPFGGVANCGVRDAICALEWLRDNVASFGGDPARIVAFGESAGGGLVLHALSSPMSRGLLAGAIVQSGATFATLDAEKAAFVAETLTKECGGAALTDIGVDELLAAQGRAISALLQPVGMMPFHPMVDDDVLPGRPVELLAAGAAAGVPLIAGSTADEMKLFASASPPPPTRDRLERRVARYAGVDDATAVAVLDAYAADLGTDDLAALWGAIFSDVEMQLPLRAVLDAHRKHAPTYAYLFTWAGPEAGACHGIDIPFPFGNFSEGWDAFVGLDDDGRALSRLIRDSWAAFRAHRYTGLGSVPHHNGPRTAVARRAVPPPVCALSRPLAPLRAQTLRKAW